MVPMVGVKHRYVIVKLLGMKGGASASSLRNGLWEKIRQRYGDWGLGMVDCLEVCEYHAAIGIAVIRCDLGTYGRICQIISEGFGSSILEQQLEVVSVSGILKKAKKRLLAYISRGSLEGFQHSVQS